MDFEHCSRSTLFWFAALVNVAGWVAVVAVTWGVCMMIELWSFVVYGDSRKVAYPAD